VKTFQALTASHILNWIFQCMSHTPQYQFLRPKLSKNECLQSWSKRPYLMKLREMSPNKIPQDALLLEPMAKPFWRHHCTYFIRFASGPQLILFSIPTIATQSILHCFRSKQLLKDDVWFSLHYLSFQLQCSSGYPLKKGTKHRQTLSHAKWEYPLNP